MEPINNIGPATPNHSNSGDFNPTLHGHTENHTNSSDINPAVHGHAENHPAPADISISEPSPPQPAPIQDSFSAHSFNDSSVKAEDSQGAFSNEYTAPKTDSAEPVVSDKPMPVVRVLSVRGVEYGMMTITLWIAAASMATGLISLINGTASFAIMAMPISLLIVTIPVFAFFFLRLKKAELANPSLALDPSKRRFSQITQFVAFLACLINVVVFVYLIMSSFGGDSKTSWGKAIGNLLVILVIAGGILAYYWANEHRLVKD